MSMDDFMRQQSAFMNELTGYMKQQTEILNHINSVVSSKTENYEEREPGELRPEERLLKYPMLSPPWDDDVGWSTVLEVALKFLKEQRTAKSEVAKKVNHHQIALFSAVVTAFLVPTVNALSAVPGQNNDQLLQNLIDLVTEIAQSQGLKFNSSSIQTPLKFKPQHSDEVSATFWYLSLVVSILCAAVTTFARFQMNDIQELPKGLTSVENVMRTKERERLVGNVLTPTFNVLHWSIVFAIGLFLAGLLYQLWNIHSSVEPPKATILATSLLGTILCGLVVLFLVIVSWHAVWNEESPFETALSRAVRSLISSVYGMAISKSRPQQILRARQVQSWWSSVYRSLFDRYAYPTEEEGSRYFFALVAKCESSESLLQVAPTVIECFNLIKPKSSADFLENFEPAIVRLLGPENNTKTKRLVIQNLLRINRAAADWEPSASMIPRVLLRILQGIERTGPMDRAKDLELTSTFRALVFFSEKPGPDNRGDLVYPDPPRNFLDALERGFGSCVDVSLNLRHDTTQVTPAFLGALLMSEMVDDHYLPGILGNVLAKGLVPQFVVAVYWAANKSPQIKTDMEDETTPVVDPRRCYQDILKRMRPQLATSIRDSKMSTKSGLLSALLDLIQRLPAWVDITHNPERRILTFCTLMGFLRCLRSIMDTKEGAIPPARPPIRESSRGRRTHPPTPIRDNASYQELSTVPQPPYLSSQYSDQAEDSKAGSQVVKIDLASDVPTTHDSNQEPSESTPVGTQESTITSALRNAERSQKITQFELLIAMAPPLEPDQLFSYSDLIALRDREALLFYMLACGDDTADSHVVTLFLEDCDRFGGSVQGETSDQAPGNDDLFELVEEEELDSALTGEDIAELQRLRDALAVHVARLRARKNHTKLDMDVNNGHTEKSD
ncbi:hypothetical protein SISNIDRAFT_464489 [Sistotremastrum niveocremeum HHB9708]|uniref:DUF6535 domain-containing protein n=1 Tax=Sistotremastrum niveocremeum HHB9708 TaxID=1314777 RepID=A0A164WXY2_9AGAM|nr:hypothetical protein SISNIDRAFT_464489 [Sistotremastrum niveocremeum HHB9708]